MKGQMASGFLFLLIGLSSVQPCIASNRSNLFRDVINVLDPDIAPFQSLNTSIDVIILITLADISEINVRKKTMAISYGIALTWQDYRLQWNASLYQGITSVQVKASKIWTPTSICISNEVKKQKCIEAKEGQVTVRTDAYVSYINSMENEVHCDLDATKFPFDSQTCYLVFFNINPSTEYLIFDDKNSLFSFTFYEPNEMWEILNGSHYKYKFEVWNVTYQQLVFQIQLKRKSFYIIISTFLPVFILSVLNLFCFVVPIASGEKMGFCMAIFLTFAVFLTIINDTLPKSSDKVPFCTIFLITQLLISGLVVILQAVTLFIHFRHSDKNDGSLGKSFETEHVDKKNRFLLTGACLDKVFFSLILACDILSVIIYAVNVR